MYGIMENAPQVKSKVGWIPVLTAPGKGDIF